MVPVLLHSCNVVNERLHPFTLRPTTLKNTLSERHGRFLSKAIRFACVSCESQTSPTGHKGDYMLALQNDSVWGVEITRLFICLLGLYTQ